MKQGSADDPFADDSDDETAPDSTRESGDGAAARQGGTTTDRTTTDGATADRTSTGRSSSGGQPARQSLPYIHSRDGVKDGRTQRPVFLREHVESGIDDLVAEMERELGEDVYKTDVTEAAMVVAQEHPELVAETLEEWGYGWD
jgi:hypothetical protein